MMTLNSLRLSTMSDFVPLVLMFLAPQLLLLLQWALASLLR